MTPQAHQLVKMATHELINATSTAEIYHVSRRLLVHSFALKTREEREAFALSPPQHRLPPGWGIEGISQPSNSSNSNTQERKETSVTTKPSISLEAYDYDQI